jgi:long-chain acyl-CoA synthetase
LCVRGPQVMAGYYQRPAETAAVHDARTAFCAPATWREDRRASGFVRLVDRKKDMITVSGFKVYPNEVEDVVASCMRACWRSPLMGVPDEKSGEAVMLFVVKQGPESLSVSGHSGSRTAART